MPRLIKIIAIYLALLPLPLFTNAQSKGTAGVLEYVRSLAKSDGGYGWEDQPDGHLTPTFAVTGVLKNLGQLPADRQPLIAYFTTHHPQRGANKEAGNSGTEMRDLVYQQIQGLRWLGADLSAFKSEVLSWKPQDHKVSNFEEHGYPVFQQELMSLFCRDLLQLSNADVQEYFRGYLASRKRGNGSFNNVPAAAGGDGNILNTCWALMATSKFPIPGIDSAALREWIRLCQLKGGGFTHQPKPAIGGIDEIAYTWAGVKALWLLKALPRDKNACIGFILSLHNSDGGFSNRPGLPSTPMATYYAVDALLALGALGSLETTPVVDRPAEKIPDLSPYRVFSVQFEAPGSGSPEEAVMLADSLHIDLWGCKNADIRWMERAQRCAIERKVPVLFFQADEAYGKAVHVDGLGTFSHIMDFIAPPGINRARALDGSSWKTYHETFIGPLLKEQGALILQVTNNEPLGRMILDESILNGGFSAVSTIHFGQNFSFWLPWLLEYRHQLPFISLQDAHGTESWWWTSELAANRTLFLAKKAGYGEMMEAIKKNWVVAVRHDSISNFKTRMQGGASGVQAYIRSNEASWRWWANDSVVPSRPWAAITAVLSADSFEVARPAMGINLRIRCRWSGLRQQLAQPLSRLETLTVNGKVVEPRYIEQKDEKGTLTDAYYLLEWPGIKKGTYLVQAQLRLLKTGEKTTLETTIKYQGTMNW